MNEPIIIPCRRSARNLGVREMPVKGGAPGYKVRRGSNTGGTSNSGHTAKTHFGLNQHNCPLSYTIQPKKGR